MIKKTAMNRRSFLTSSLAAVANVPAGRLDFSWDTVPVYNHIGKSEDHFNAKEVELLARFPLVTIEKGQAVRKGVSCEEGIYRAAEQIKKVNPKTKVLFYLNAVIDWPGYAARQAFERNPRWALRSKDGKEVLFKGRKLFDCSVPEVREWWSGVCGQAMKSAPLDGVFLDAIPKIAMQEAQNRREWGDAKYEAVEHGARELMRLTKKKIGKERILLFNGLRGDLSRWKDGGMRFLEHADAAMIEHFGGISGRDAQGRVKPDMMAADLRLMQQAAAKGKMIFVKGWPEFTKTYPDTSKYPPSYDEKVRHAREQITFPLAAFLAAAEPHCYFGYSWMYRAQDGWLEWYPEYSKRLGPPQGPARQSGLRYTREFLHATIEVDLGREWARIDWR